MSIESNLIPGGERREFVYRGLDVIEHSGQWSSSSKIIWCRKGETIVEGKSNVLFHFDYRDQSDIEEARLQVREAFDRYWFS